MPFFHANTLMAVLIHGMANAVELLCKQYRASFWFQFVKEDEIFQWDIKLNE